MNWCESQVGVDYVFVKPESALIKMTPYPTKKPKGDCYEQNKQTVVSFWLLHPQDSGTTKTEKNLPKPSVLYRSLATKL